MTENPLLVNAPFIRGQFVTWRSKEQVRVAWSNVRQNTGLWPMEFASFYSLRPYFETSEWLMMVQQNYTAIIKLHLT